MSQFYRIGRVWHAAEKHTKAGIIDEQTDDANRIMRGIKQEGHAVCERCRAEICFAYMIADNEAEGERQTMTLPGME